jgi:hypothetical protein
VGKLLIELTLDPSAGKPQKVQLVEPKSSKVKGSVATGSGSGSGSGSVTASTASHQKVKQLVHSVSNKNKVTGKLLEELIMGSGSDKSARQLRMKRQVTDGARKKQKPD